MQAPRQLVLRRVAFAGFALAHLGMLAGGLVYATTRRMLPYHEQALGLDWEQLTPMFQALYLTMCRALGVATVIAALALLVLLTAAWRRGQTWALVAVPLLTLGYGIPILAITIWVHVKTGADTPVRGLALGIALTLLATIASLFAHRPLHPLRRRDSVTHF